MKNCSLNQKSLYLMYLAANNLYGWAMCRKLPLNNFKGIDKPNEIFTTKTIFDYDKETNDKGYLLEADLGYPEESYNDHSDLPFCPYKIEKLTHNTKDSEAIQIARKRNHESLPKQSEKLLTTLENKKKSSSNYNFETSIRTWFNT